MRTPAAVPLMRVEGRTQNLRRGLHPSDSDGLRGGKAGAVLHDIDHDGVDFVCMQETGIRSNTTPPALKEVFRRDGHTVLVQGTHSDNAFDNVGIAIHKRWKVDHIFRMPASGRCLGVALRRGTSRIFVASVLLPTGLDPLPANSGVWTNIQKRAEVRRIFAQIDKWSASYEVVFVCGDLNCTVTRGLDRDDEGTGPRPDNLLLQTILAPRSRFEDLFRSLWPTAHGWTRAGARLDYALLKAPATAVKVSCEVSDDFDSDHAGVTFAVHLRDDPGLAAPPWSRRTTQAHKASPAERAAFVSSANTRINEAHVSWSLKVEQADSEPALLAALQSGQAALAEAITWTAMEELPQSRGHSQPDYRQGYLRSRITALTRMVRRVRRLAAGRMSWRHWTETSSNSALRGLKNVGLLPKFRLQDIDSWARWCLWADGEIANLKKRLLELNRLPAEEAGTGSFPERLWRRARGKRSFFDKYFRPSCGSIESAVDPVTGVRSWDPATYLKLLRAAVMKPFSRGTECPLHGLHGCMLPSRRETLSCCRLRDW